MIVAGNLFWAMVGLLAVSGPASGTPSEVIMRAMSSIRGNRVNFAIIGWFACVCYLALTWAAASLAAFSLAADLGAPPGTAAKVAIIVGIAAVTLAISMYGHAIVRLYCRSPCLATSFYTSPIARAADGTDLSLPVGLLVSAAAYLLMMRSRHTADPSRPRSNAFPQAEGPG